MQPVGAERWKVEICSAVPKLATILELEEGGHKVHATQVVSMACNGIDDVKWKLELSAFAYAEWTEALFIGQALANCVKSPVAGRIATPVRDRKSASKVIFVVTRLLARSAATQINIASKAIILITHVLAAMASCLLLLYATIRYCRKTVPQDEAEGTLVQIALHAEKSTRTSHVLRLLRDRESSASRAEPMSVLLLGRPRQTVQEICADLGLDQFSHITVNRPLDLRSAFESILTSFSKVIPGYSALLQIPFQLPIRENIAICYRFAQGAAHNQWWASRDFSEVTVALFGHTGTADTTGLEEAMQRSGVYTVHVAHGNNTGWPFNALSDLGIFTCRHDAELAKDLLAYKKTSVVPGRIPRIGQAGTGWLLLTAYSHPMAASWVESGISPDLSVVDIVARAARLCGIDVGQVVWRPHPSIGLINHADSSRLKRAVQNAGFRSWVEGASLDLMVEFDAIITTPSTVMVDALRLGKSPIVLAAQPIQSDSVYSAYSLLANDLQTLSKFLVPMSDDERATRFVTAWKTIEPGISYTFDQLLKHVEDMRDQRV